MKTASNTALYEDVQARVRRENPTLSPTALASAMDEAYETAFARYFDNANAWEDNEARLDEFFESRLQYQESLPKWRPMADKESDNNK